MDLCDKRCDDVPIGYRHTVDFLTVKLQVSYYVRKYGMLIWCKIDLRKSPLHI